MLRTRTLALFTAVLLTAASVQAQELCVPLLRVPGVLRGSVTLRYENSLRGSGDELHAVSAEPEEALTLSAIAVTPKERI